MQPDPYLETTEEWGWDMPTELDEEVCPVCGGEGGDPLNDFCLPCPWCGLG